MAFPGLGEDSSDSSSSSDEEDEAQRRAAWQKVLDNIAAEAEELGGRTHGLNSHTLPCALSDD